MPESCGHAFSCLQAEHNIMLLPKDSTSNRRGFGEYPLPDPKAETRSFPCRTIYQKASSRSLIAYKCVSESLTAQQSIPLKCYSLLSRSRNIIISNSLILYINCRFHFFIMLKPVIAYFDLQYCTVQYIFIRKPIGTVYENQNVPAICHPPRLGASQRYR